MMVGHCHAHSHGQNRQPHLHRHHHPFHHSRSGSDSSREESEHYSNVSSGISSSASSGGVGSITGRDSGSSTTNITTSSDYSLTLSSDVGERILHRHPSASSLLDSIERRTQRTYRYGIGLVCVGATLNWLGFAQGTTYIDPLRYLGVACVLTGSFCVCLAMCRWLSKPISVQGHHVGNLEEERVPGDVHVINVSVPMYVPTLHEEYRPTKPPDYEQIVGGEEAFPPPYDEAVKLRPSEFFGTPTPSHQGIMTSAGEVMEGVTQHSGGGGEGNPIFASQLSHSTCQLSPSHHHPSAHHELSRALLLDHRDTESLIGSSIAPSPTPQPTPRHAIQTPQHHHYLNRTITPVGDDPPPAYEPSPRPSISSCSSIAPLIPTSTSRFDLPPSFSVRRLFGVIGGTTSTSTSPRDSPNRRRENGNNANNSINSNTPNMNEQLHDQVIDEDATLTLVVHQQQGCLPSLQLGNSDNSNHVNQNIV